MKINLICNNVLPEYSTMNEFDKYLYPILFLLFFTPFFFFALNNYSVFLEFTYVQYVRLVANVFRYRFAYLKQKEIELYTTNHKIS